MCGIAGFWQNKKTSGLPEEILTRMGDALKHRGPDDSGIFCHTSGVGFVHRRLSIVDLSPAGHQPMASASGRYTIVFNGEVYNFEEIKAELGAGYAWRGHSDTEVMLEAIDRWGLDQALKRFVGMFAFALWDRQEQELSLVRDRLGIKPLYYGRVNGDFIFGSELKAIGAYPGFEGRINRDALALYMRFSYVPAPHCIYEGLHKLQQGYILALKQAESEPRLRCFWSANEIAQSGVDARMAGSDAEVIQELESKLSRAIQLRMIADVPLGAFLSGGIDSSTVVALMQAQSSRPIKTFTIGFHEKDYNEAVHARRIAEHLGTEHTELYVSAQEALNVVPLLSEMYDEPFADVSQIPTYLVSQLARRSVTVSLSGDGGDELFAGYQRYFRTMAIWGWQKRVPAQLRRVFSQVMQSASPGTIDSAYQMFRPLMPRSQQFSAVGDKVHKLAPMLNSSGPESVYLKTVSHWSDPTDIVLGSREPDDFGRFFKTTESLPCFEERMMLTDLVNYLPDDVLTKVDRASMAVSLEARVPILDHRVVEFAWKLPMHFKIRNGTSKWILRQVLYKHVPAALVERPKMGFGVPIDHWLRGPLRTWAEDLLSEESLNRQGLFNVDAVRTKLKEHLSGSRNWQYLLWDVLIFQNWLFDHAMNNVNRNVRV
jgi:asparagine synthase (glutamine-hydrolysing)